MAEREKRSERPAHKKPVKGPYIVTDTGNIISRKSRLEGLSHIILSGRVVLQHDVILRGDLCPPIDTSKSVSSTSSSSSSSSASTSRTAISIGKYTHISERCTLHPPSRLTSGLAAGASAAPGGGALTLAYFPLRIGSNVFVGQGTFISAASIGSHVYIGADVVIGNACIIADRVKILDGAVLPEAMQVPPGVVVGGVPARVLGEVGEGWGVESGTVGEEWGGWIEGGELKELIRAVQREAEGRK